MRPLRTCDTCEHEARDINEVPCTDCRSPGLGAGFTNWTPKMPKQSLFTDGPSNFEQAAQAVMRPATAAGRKDDAGKLDVTLFFDDLPHAVEAVTEVLQWAVTKKQPTPYERGSWQGVDDFQRRYRGALLRHQLNRAKALIEPGRVVEPKDAETGLMELAHIATDAMFMLEMAVRKTKGLPVPEGA